MILLYWPHKLMELKIYATKPGFLFIYQELMIHDKIQTNMWPTQPFA